MVLSNSCSSKIVIAIVYYSILSILTSEAYQALEATMFSEQLAGSIKRLNDHYTRRHITQDWSTVIHVISTKVLVLA